MLISAQLVQTNDADWINVYEYVHDTDGWPGDPSAAFDWPMSLVATYEEIPAGGNLILATLDVACPNEIDLADLYARFREYAAVVEELAGAPPFIWPLPPVALRLWVQPQLVSTWRGVLMDLMRRVLLP